MVLEVLIMVVLVGTVWWWQRRHRPDHDVWEGDEVSLLPYDDLPPIGAFDPVPAEDALDAYVEIGLEQLDGYLSGRDQAA